MRASSGSQHLAFHRGVLCNRLVNAALGTVYSWDTIMLGPSHKWTLHASWGQTATDLQQLALGVPLQCAIPLLIVRWQFASFIFQLLKLLQLRKTGNDQQQCVALWRGYCLSMQYLLKRFSYYEVFLRFILSVPNTRETNNITANEWHVSYKNSSDICYSVLRSSKLTFFCPSALVIMRWTWKQDGKAQQHFNTLCTGPTSPCCGLGCAARGRRRWSQSLRGSSHKDARPSAPCGGSSRSADQQRCCWERKPTLAWTENASVRFW